MKLDAWRKTATARLRSNSDEQDPVHLDVDALLCHTLGQPRTWLFTHSDEALSPVHIAQLDELLERRQRGEPLAYLVGVREFRSRLFSVTPAVLVPRDDTELLVERGLLSIEALASAEGECRVLDLGTGSGIVAISLALEHRGTARIIATDIDGAALALARRNAQRLGAPVHFLQGSWLDSFDDQSIDIVVSNPPYIARHDAHLSALAHEPQKALVSGADGLEAIAEIATSAQRVLKPGGHVILEHGYDQQTTVCTLLEQLGYLDVEGYRDLAGNPRVSSARTKHVDLRA